MRFVIVFIRRSVIVSPSLPLAHFNRAATVCQAVGHESNGLS